MRTMKSKKYITKQTLAKLGKLYTSHAEAAREIGITETMWYLIRSKKAPLSKRVDKIIGHIIGGGV